MGTIQLFTKVNPQKGSSIDTGLLTCHIEVTPAPGITSVPFTCHCIFLLSLGHTLFDGCNALAHCHKKSKCFHHLVRRQRQKALSQVLGAWVCVHCEVISRWWCWAWHLAGPAPRYNLHIVHTDPDLGAMSAQSLELSVHSSPQMIPRGVKNILVWHGCLIVTT